MFKHLLIATDGSEIAAKAVRGGLELAKSLGARAVVVTATDPWLGLMNADTIPVYFPVEEYERAAKAEAGRLLGKVRDEALTLGVECETLHINGFPAEAIVETAEAKGCDLIVVGSHGRRGIARLLLGSQATKVVTLSSVPVLVCR
jgi:nucleotide-binding universal stress UspA family protein